MILAGLSPAEVIEITRTEVARVLGELSSTAKELAEEKIEALSNRVLEHFMDKPELFSAFTEPDFQYSLQDAGRVAASNDEEHTEQLLVDLLANRAEKGDGPRVRLATSQAIRAADKLSSDALSGVTALWAVQYLMWANPDNLVSQLTGTIKIADSLVKLGLPSNPAWMEDADALNLLRISPGGILTRKTYLEMVQGRFAAQLVAGIDAKESVELFAEVEQVAPGFLEKLRGHPLKKGFVMLPGSTKEELFAGLPHAAASSPELNQLVEQNGYGSLDQAAVKKMEEFFADVPSFQTVSQWWNPLPVADLTVVGDVIGFINARRYMTFGGAATVSEFLDLRST